MCQTDSPNNNKTLSECVLLAVATGRSDRFIKVQLCFKIYANVV